MALDDAAYATMLRQLLPPGAAWSGEPGSEMRALLDALAVELRRMDAEIEAIRAEADPSTATTMLEDWERNLALPGDCVQALTEPDRRAAIIAKLLGAGDQSKATYESLAAALGYTIASIETYPQMNCTSPCTSPLNSGPWPHAAKITTSTGANDALLECVLRAHAHVHTFFVFNYV